ATFKDFLGRTGDGVMATVRQETGGGGLQVLWDRRGLDERNTAGTAEDGLGPGIDTRGVGGYIIIPPSNHVSGGSYRWARDHGPDEHALLPLPKAVVAELQRARDAKAQRRGSAAQEVLPVL